LATVPIRITEVDPKRVQRLLPGVPANAAAEAAHNAKAVVYRQGETVRPPDDATFPAVVADGSFRLRIRASDGREATLCTVRAGAMIGLTTLFYPGAAPRSARSVVAVERGTLIFFEAGTISRLSHQYDELAMHLVRDLVDWGLAVSDAAGRFAFMNVRQRVASHLLDIAVVEIESPETPVAAITQQQLADAVGSVREVVARTLRELRLAGLISVGRARITVLDRERLSREAVGIG
jgi:CRP/FNR family cyclic AMP-dependent transcriptional regulator